MSEIRTLAFNELPRPTRERFVAITRNQAGPAPIFANRQGGGAIAGWIVLIVVAIVLELGVTFAEFGSLWHPTQSAGAILLHAAAIFLIVLSIGGIIKRARMMKALPFVPGAYVFPMDTVIARDGVLKIFSAGSLASLQPVHHYRNGIYTQTTFTFSFTDGTREVFSCYGQPLAQQMLDRLRGASGQLADAVARQDVAAIQALDPFFDARMSDWRPAPYDGGPSAGTIPGWMKLGWAFGLAAGFLIGPALWAVRNLASDASAFSKAKQWDSVYGYEDYLRGGWLHKDEVKTDLLPRARLKEVNAKTTVSERIEAIQKVIDDYPGSKVQPDAQKALDDAIHDAYLEAKGKNTVAALRDFQKKYPKAADVPTAKKRIHELFTKTLTDFKPRASKTDPILVPFVESLLSYMEANDSPAMEVRFRRHNSPSLSAADKILAIPDPEFDTPGSALAGASSHFEPEDAAPRETAVVDAMKKGFATVFPADVLPLAKGTDLNPLDKAVPLVTRPSILVDYTVAWSGSTYVDKTEGRRFVGVIFDFDVVMTIPGDAKLLKLKFSVRPPERFSVSYSSFSDPTFGSLYTKGLGGPSDSQVYEVMALRAFDQLSSKIQDDFFQPLPKKPLPNIKKPVYDDDEE